MRQIPTTIKNQKLVEKRREQILLAAIRLFSRKGFHKTNLRELAEEAGLSAGNIYDYVSSKEDIFYLIHSYVAAIVAEKLDQSVLNISDPIEKLRRMVRAEFRVMNKWADAILLIYQESHILSRSFLHLLLEKEKNHVSKFEVVIQECIDKGLVRECNVRMTANLIKSMVDTWVIKRWDLRGHVTQLEAERTILDLVFHGFFLEAELPWNELRADDFLLGKNVLLINGQTILGQSLGDFFIKRRAKLAIHSEIHENYRERLNVLQEEHENLHIFSKEEFGDLTPDLLDRIEEQTGPIDICIHDLGCGGLCTNMHDGKDTHAAAEMDANMRCALDMAPYIADKMSGRSSGHLIYISPWAWDRHANRIRYETVTAGVRALTRDLAVQVSQSGVNVNCLVPGYIRTIRPSILEQKLAVELASAIPMGYMGEMQDITDAILFLSSDASKYVTGQEIKINGGHGLGGNKQC